MTTSQLLSPFSTRCGYAVNHQYRAKRQPELHLSVREQYYTELVRLTGAAAAFQILKRRRDKKVLFILAAAKILHQYVLTGPRTMYVWTWHEMELHTMLRALALNHFLLSTDALYANSQQGYVPDSHVYLDGIKWDLLILRYGDKVNVVDINSRDRVLILSEVYLEAFDEIYVPTRIVLDSDLVMGGKVIYHQSKNSRQAI